MNERAAKLELAAVIAPRFVESMDFAIPECIKHGQTPGPLLLLMDRDKKIVGMEFKARLRMDAAVVQPVFASCNCRATKS